MTTFDTLIKRGLILPRPVIFSGFREHWFFAFIAIPYWNFCAIKSPSRYRPIYCDRIQPIQQYLSVRFWIKFQSRCKFSKLGNIIKLFNIIVLHRDYLYWGFTSLAHWYSMKDWFLLCNKSTIFQIINNLFSCIIYWECRINPSILTYFPILIYGYNFF